MRVVLVAGARPNFMKIAPVYSSLSASTGIRLELVHTGQHYDERMSASFFDELGIPAPDANLEVGSGSHGAQTAEVMKRFEAFLEPDKPDLVVVVGDVNSTLACALAAKKLKGVGVAHVEAGLRSHDRSMPEELNRVVTDSIADLLFVSEPSGLENLRREGVPDKCIHFVGNVMIDTLMKQLPRARACGFLEQIGLEPRRYGVLTLHRPANVDCRSTLETILDGVASLSTHIPIVFPVHPRCRPAVDRWRESRGCAVQEMKFLGPVSYLSFLHLIADARLVLTDSGGVQEETTVLGVRCLTLRENTERPVTVSEGTNTLVGRNPERMLALGIEALRGEDRHPSTPVGWDGRAADRIAEVITAWSGTLR